MRRLGLSKPLYYKQLLSTLYTHMEVLKVPSVNGMGVMERRLLSQDPDFSKVETTLVGLLEFLMPIVWDVQQVFDKKEIERYTLKVRMACQNPQQTPWQTQGLILGKAKVRSEADPQENSCKDLGADFRQKAFECVNVVFANLYIF